MLHILIECNLKNDRMISVRLQGKPFNTLEKEMATHSVPLPGKSHGRRSLVGYSPRGRKESDTTERLHYYYTTTKSRFLVTTGKQRYLTSFKSPQCYRHLWQRTRELFTVCWIIKLPLMTLLWSQKLVLSMILSLL